MGAAYFYHLTRRPLAEVLASLIERARGAGWRVVVRAPSEERAAWLDEKLWLGEGFLPHGRAGGAFDADQPVLLTTGRAAPNGAACLMTVGGAATDPDEVAGFERVCILFDGAEEAMVEAARTQWRTLTAAGIPAQYWSEESGRWAKQAET